MGPSVNPPLPGMHFSLMLGHSPKDPCAWPASSLCSLRCSLAAGVEVQAVAGGTTPPPATTCPLPTPITAPTFSANILPALQLSCGGNNPTGCHGQRAFGSTDGHISYFTGSGRTPRDVYNDLLHLTPNAPPGPPNYFFITPKDPTHSWLLVKITSDNPGGSGYGGRMPQGGANVCQATVDNITAWINAEPVGAPF